MSYVIEGQAESLPAAVVHIWENEQDSKQDAHLLLDHGTLEFSAEDKVGSGGYGEVFRGLWNFNQVAIKRFWAETPTPAAVAEFRKEARIMTKMRSDYIVQLRGYCEKPQYCLVMEYMAGGSLFNLLHNQKEDIPWLDRLQIALDFTYGLAQLHKEQILHRDLKSLNVLLHEKGGVRRAKLADFGLSQIKVQSAACSQQRPSIGTLQWLAPEVTTLDPHYTKASDMYSYGVLLWELAERRIPFAKAKPDHLILALQAGTAREAFSPNVQHSRPGFTKLAESCWETPASRPTAVEAAKVLEQLLKAEMKEVVERKKKKQAYSQSVSHGEDQQESHSAQVDENPASEQQDKQDAHINEEQQNDAQQPEQDAHDVLPAEQPQHSHVNEEQPKDGQQPVQEPHAILPAEQPQQQADVNEEQPKDGQPEQEDAHELPAEQPLQQTHVKEEQLKPVQEEAHDVLPAEQPQQHDGSADQQQHDQPQDVAGVGLQQGIGEFLRWVANGEQDRAEEMLKKNPELVLKTGSVQDPSGREFKTITGFQYAIWGLDWEMARMIIGYLPREDGVAQFQELSNKGTAHGKRFSLKDLTQGLTTYAQSYDSWSVAERHKNWNTVVGKCQVMLPVSVVNAYCGGRRSVGTEIGPWYTANYQNGTLGQTFAYVGCRAEFGPSPYDKKCQMSHDDDCPDNSECNDVYVQCSIGQWVIKVEDVSSWRAEQDRDTLNKLFSRQPDLLLELIATHDFLHKVAYGDQEAVEKILSSDLLMRKGHLRDPAGREFHAITGFQYAVWSLDWHMCKVMLKHLGKDAAAAQLLDLATAGTRHGKRFLLDPLITALTIYENNFQDWTSDQRKKHWNEVVGSCQAALPVSVVNEYCHSGWTQRKFQQETKRSTETSIGPWYTATHQGGKLGETFAYCRAQMSQSHPPSGLTEVPQGEARQDRDALAALLSQRKVMFDPAQFLEHALPAPPAKPKQPTRFWGFFG